MGEGEPRKVEDEGETGRGEDPREAELARKLPEGTDPAQERGERIEAGKAIATGGKGATQSPSSRAGGGGD
jgi:hypothetical protein